MIEVSLDCPKKNCNGRIVLFNIFHEAKVGDELKFSLKTGEQVKKCPECGMTVKGIKFNFKEVKDTKV